jgi:hypothetical protein
VVPIEEIVVDVLSLHSAFAGGEISLKSRTADEDASLWLDWDEVGPIKDKVFAILEHLHKFDDRFVGVSYEYNDGAGTRVSGYSEEGVTIFEAEVDAPSQHERLAARQRLTAQLLAAGLSSIEVDALLDVEATGDNFVTA